MVTSSHYSNESMELAQDILSRRKKTEGQKPH